MEPTDRTEEPTEKPTIQGLLKTYSALVSEVEDETGGAKKAPYIILNEVAKKLKEQERFEEEAQAREVINNYVFEQIDQITSRVHYDPTHLVNSP